MRLLKIFFGLYLLFLCFLCFFYIYSMAIRIGKYDLYWEHIIPVLIVVVPASVMSLLNGVRLILPHKQLFQSWKSLAVMSNIFCVLATCVLGYLFFENNIINLHRYRDSIDYPQENTISSKIGQEAPDFLATDQEGNNISISTFKGKFVLLDFWATWCGPCVLEIPNVRKISERYNKDRLTVIGVSLDMDQKRLMSFLKNNKIFFPQIYDKERKICHQYNVSFIPMNFLIDPNGIIISSNLRGLQLEKVISGYLK